MVYWAFVETFLLLLRCSWLTERIWKYTSTRVQQWLQAVYIYSLVGYIPSARLLLLLRIGNLISHLHDREKERQEITKMLYGAVARLLREMTMPTFPGTRYVIFFGMDTLHLQGGKELSIYFRLILFLPPPPRPLSQYTYPFIPVGV